MTHMNARKERAPAGQETAPGGSEEQRQDSPAPGEADREAPQTSSPAPGGAMDPGDAPVDPSKTVLVVEDDLDTADSIKVKLEAQGYNVLTVFDGLTALETARRITPALIVLDVMVPGLMGYHVCRLLKFDERYRGIPIIILTGKVDREAREIGTKAGADLYVTKPFDLDDFLREVRKFIG